MSSEISKSLINLGDLSKPAVVLIEKVSDAVGVLFEPVQIVRKAKAEAKAELIKADSDIEISHRQSRALNRILVEETNKQKNIEQITAKALPMLEEDSQPDKVENDWITNFFDKCRLISDDEMQVLWAKVLSGEANASGSFSKRTVNFLAEIDKYEAMLFTKLCGFGLVDENEEFNLFIDDFENEIFTKNGLNFRVFAHLESIGLIQTSSISYARFSLPKRLSFYYFDEPIILEMQNEMDNSLSFGNVIITQTGRELASICRSKPVVGFKGYLMKRWKSYIKTS